VENHQVKIFLENIKDDPREVEKCVDLFYTLQRTKGSPILEIITILKFEKPLLHSLLKTRLQNRLGLSMLFSLTMDYEQSKKNLVV
jgi:hypothetical protein